LRRGFPLRRVAQRSARGRGRPDRRGGGSGGGRIAEPGGDRGGVWPSGPRERCGGDGEGLRGVPAQRRAVGACPALPRVLASRLLRLLEEPARDEALLVEPASHRALARAGRELALVLRGRDRGVTWDPWLSTRRATALFSGAGGPRSPRSGRR